MNEPVDPITDGRSQRSVNLYKYGERHIDSSNLQWVPITRVEEADVRIKELTYDKNRLQLEVNDLRTLLKAAKSDANAVPEMLDVVKDHRQIMLSKFGVHWLGTSNCVAIDALIAKADGRIPMTATEYQDSNIEELKDE